MWFPPHLAPKKEKKGMRKGFVSLYSEFAVPVVGLTLEG